MTTRALISQHEVMPTIESRLRRALSEYAIELRKLAYTLPNGWASTACCSCRSAWAPLLMKWSEARKRLAWPAGRCRTSCDACGSLIAPATERAECKQVTVLFADVVRSMDIAALVGAQRLREITGERSVAGVQRYGDTVDKFTGDSIMAVFGAPTRSFERIPGSNDPKWAYE